MKKLSHINIMKLKELIREDSTLYLVFEFLDGGNLYEKTKERSQVFNEPRIKNIMYVRFTFRLSMRILPLFL